MDIKDSTDHRKAYLSCCSQSHFSIEFRKSDSTLAYEELRSEQAKATGRPFRLGDPDILVAICLRCGNEITITDTEGKVPNVRTAASDVYWGADGRIKVKTRVAHDASGNYPDKEYYDPRGYRDQRIHRPEDLYGDSNWKAHIDGLRRAARGDPLEWE